MGAATATALDGIGIAEGVNASSAGLSLHNAGGFQFSDDLSWNDLRCTCGGLNELGGNELE
jgi:hypothetical protein